MKLIGSWKDKYFGFQIHDWNYIIYLVPKGHRYFGYYHEHYDSLPITIIGIWYIGLQRIYKY